MHTPRNKTSVIRLIDHSDTIAVIGSLILWFMLARTFWNPTKQKSIVNNDALLVRSLPDTLTNQEHAAAPEQNNSLVQEWVESEEEIPAPLVYDPEQISPELFVKTRASGEGYLISFTTEHFTIGKDGYVLLYQDDKEVTKLYASPYYISKTFIQQSTDIGIWMTNLQGEKIGTNEHVSFK